MFSFFFVMVSAVHVCLLMETAHFRIDALPVQVFIRMFVNIAASWNGSKRTRNAVPAWMRFAGLNGAVVGHPMGGRSSKVPRVEVCPLLRLVIWYWAAAHMAYLGLLS